MKSLRRRLIFHFSIQFISLSIAIIILLFALLFLLIQHMSNQELRKNYPAGVLEYITTETVVEDNKAEIDKQWRQVLREKHMWAQVVNCQGEVVGSSNTPSSLPKHYSVGDILQIAENKQFREYTVLSEFDNTDKQPYIFLVGYKDIAMTTLQTLVTTYNHQGQISETERRQLEKQLKKIDGTLQIINENGDIIDTAGKPMNTKKYEPLDIISKKMTPGIYSTTTAVYNDPSTNHTWLLHTPKKKDKNQTLSVMTEYLLGFGIVGTIVLLITLSLSFWNGFRYGQPLFIFTSWLERMKQGNYEEVLTEQERKKIFRKNGKVRIRYRLYKEVINAFYAMAEKLDLSVKERAKLEKTREEWMTGISHDLRTPLSTVQGYGHLLESGQYNWSKEELEEVGQTIREKGEYMLHLIEDFSLTFELKNNELHLSKETFQVNQLLETIISKFIQDRTLQDYHFHFEPITIQVEIEADQKWFERMMDNLIFNAIKHNPSGTTIIIRASKSADGLHIWIEDNGVGMDKETIEQLFERYYRGTNTDERIEGAGLGMSIAKQIATLHGATVEVRSEVGTGTTVHIHFPRY
ncbi:HAMP domain-containing sensor histidine kinase [Bacillus sp. FJAT-52991]|uniref:histidine kinase n=1 Tax=Bacillus kandeliae TaxID=3129297 RepID=A0ABZ2N8N0_9BACI